MLALAACLGCFEAHRDGGPGSEPGPGAGTVDSGCRVGCRTIFDAGIGSDDFEPPPYYDLRGSGSDGSIGECGAVDGFVRCDECGQEACPNGTLCSDYLGVCVARHPASGGCSFTLLPGRLQDEYPWVPNPCAVQASDDGTADEPFSGIAMPPSYCVAARELPDLPPQKCVYPDGTEVITGPPEEPCPGPEGSMLVCGGSCGEVICPGTATAAHGKNPCVGFSDTRAFGICAFMARRCAESNASEILTECETHPITWFSGPCACMVLDPRATLAGADATGFVVPADACERYESFYPDQVECRDESWNRL